MTDMSMKNLSLISACLLLGACGSTPAPPMRITWFCWASAGPATVTAKAAARMVLRVVMERTPFLEIAGGDGFTR